MKYEMKPMQDPSLVKSLDFVAHTVKSHQDLSDPLSIKNELNERKSK
ncbi:MAG: hypothetical protein IJS14_10810 [Lentisphaeria bacterium]|nr:hypothetical protein [Lentisphaeria bacterium]